MGQDDKKDLCDQNCEVCLDPDELRAMVGDMDSPDGARVEWARRRLQENGGVRPMNEMTQDMQPAQIMGRPTHDARALTDGGRQAHIQLDDKIYTLCITRAGKLILTK